MSAQAHDIEDMEHRIHALEQELSEFTYITSHDLAASFRHIHGFSGLVAQEMGATASPQLRSYIDFIVAAATKCDAMLDRLLIYSRIQRKTLELDACDLAMVLDIVRLQLGHEIQESGAEITACPLGSIYADQELLTIAVKEVMSNAIKFRRAGVPPRIRIDVVEDGETLRLRIADNGIGLPPVDQERLFWMFYRGNPEDPNGGYGTGLTTARRILRRHGGDIAFLKAHQEGACAEITLPRGQTCQEVRTT